MELSNRAISPRNVSLLNFDPNDRRMCFLTSPRSSEACLRLGIEEHELLVKNRNDILSEGIPQQFRDQVEEFIQLKLGFYEALRTKRVERCIEMRSQIIEDRMAAEKQAQAEAANEQQSEDLNETERGFHFWKNKQVSELDFIVEKANKYTEIQLKHQNAENNFKRINEEKRMYYENKNRAFSAIRARWIKEKEEEKEKLELVRQSFEIKKAENEYKWKEKQDYMVQIRSSEAKKKETERKEKKERAQSRVLSTEQKKQEEAAMKKKLMELKSLHVQKIMDHKKEKISEKMKQKQKIFEQKLYQISEFHESRRNILWNKYTQRMKKSEDQRQKIQEDKFKAIDLRKVQNIIQAREMRQSWVQMTELSPRYISNPTEEGEYDVEVLLKKEKWKHQHNRVESGIDARIQEKLLRQADILEIKRRNVLKSMETKATRAEVQRSVLLSSNKKNQMLQFLKEQEAKAHTTRKEKADKYHNEELLQKLTLKNLSLREKATEKELQMVKRERFSKDVASEKHKLGEIFQKVKMHAARETFRSSQMNSARHSALHTTCTETFLTEFNEVKRAAAVEKPIIKSRSRNNVQGQRLNSSLVEWPSKKQKGLPYFLNVTNGNFGFMRPGRKYSPEKARQSFEMSSSKEEISSISHPKHFRHGSAVVGAAMTSENENENSGVAADVSLVTKDIVQMYLDPTSSKNEVALKSEETQNALLAGNESNLTEVKN